MQERISRYSKDLRWDADRIILALKNVRSLNGLFGLQSYSSDTNNQHEEIMQLWYARSFNNCNLIEMPQSVSDQDFGYGGLQSF